MKIFRKIMRVINRVFTPFWIGYSTYDLFVGDYKKAAWILFVVSILLMIGYLVEALSDIKEDS